MRVDDGDASTLAKTAARAEMEGSRLYARRLRFDLMVALRRVTAAHASLAEAARVVVEDGTDLVLDDAALPDDVLVYDLVQGPAIAYEQLTNWVASLEGRVSLAQLMLEGPPSRWPHGSRMMVAPDGHSWSVPDLAVSFDAGVKERYERDHGGELLDIRVFAADLDDPQSMWTVEEVRDGGVRMTVPASAVRDFGALYRSIMVERGKVAR